MQAAFHVQFGNKRIYNVSDPLNARMLVVFWSDYENGSKKGGKRRRSRSFHNNTFFQQ